jgi:endonuclease YncB( thermonuclease family)
MGICNSNAVEHEKKAHVRKLKEMTLKDAQDPRYYFNEAKILKVIDGDTVVIGVYHNNEFVKFNARIYGIDCDEMHGGTEVERKNAQLAKKFVEMMILGKVVNVEVLNNRIINNIKIKEKFGRLLLNIKTHDNKDVAEELCSAGLARQYFGGTKTNKEPLHPNISLSSMTDQKSDNDSAIEY